MTNPRHTIHQLRDTHAALTHIIREYPAWHRWVTNLLADGYPTGSDFNVTSRGAISDPTAATALSRQRHTNLITDTEQLARRLHELANELTAVLSKAPPRIDIQAAVRAARCSGAVDPTCQRLADGRRQKSGLCDRCWQVAYRNQAKAS